MHVRSSRYTALAFVLLLGLVLAFPALAQKHEGEVTVMVLPFEINAEAKLDYLHTKLPGMLAQRLTESGVRVVPQDEVYTLIQKRKVKMLDLATARALAAAAHAQYAVYGSMSQAGETVSMDVRLVAATGDAPARPIYITKSGSAEVVPAVEELAKKIKNNVYVSDIVTEITVNGLRHLDKDMVMAKLKVQKGDVYDAAQLNEEIKRIFDLGFFDDVKISVDDLPEGKKLIVDVVEKPRIMAIGVIGSGGVDQDDVIEVMSTKTGSVLNPKILADDLGKIRELFRKEGYPTAKVTYKLEQTESSQARLNIVVEQAVKQYIADIKVQGNQAFSEGDLTDEMAMSPRTIISWITGSGVFHEELLDRDAAAIEDYYANHGYIDAKVTKPLVEYKDDGIHITYTVVEGERWKVASVSFKGDILVPEEKLYEITKMNESAKYGEWFNRSTLREDTEKLTRFYNDFGYAYAEADLEVTRQEDSNSLDITYVLNKNQKVHIRRVTIEGNDRTRDNVIRREMTLNDGDLFSGTHLKLSNERLTKLDLFESADIETVQTGDPNEVDLKVKVKEKPTGSLSGGVGYSSYVGAYVGVKLQEKNLFGKGWIAGLQGSFSGMDSAYVATFTNPSLYDTKMAAGFDAYYTTYEFPDFDKDTAGAILRFAYPLGDWTSIFLGYRLDNYNIRNVHRYASNEIKKIEGSNWASVLTATVARDSTNRKINPSAGSRNAVTLEYGGGALGGDDQFIKAVADTSWYYELPMRHFKEHILHFHAQAGAVFENFGGGTVPVFENFYLGGMNSIRGYETRRIATRDSRTDEYIGGSNEFFMNLEYIFPLETKLGLVGLVFFDAGDAWRDDDFSLKKSIGAGIRWFSPMGPLRLEYGYGLDNIYDQDSHHKLEFSVGQFF